jgi:cytochrome-b5 reductase
LFIAGGAGITPIYSLTNSILKNPDDKTRIDLVWGVNGVRDIVLRDELEALQKQHPDRLRVTYCVSGSGDTQLDAMYKKGYITQAVLQEVVNRYDTGNWGDVKGKKVFLCGPPAMEDAIAGRSGILRELGVDKRSIHRF